MIETLDALDIAKYVVCKCDNDGVPITNLQLQKILYFIQKEFLITEGHPAFYDLIEAWQFGPVVPSVYYFFCGFGAMPIFSFAATGGKSISDHYRAIIDSIVNDKRKMNPWELVNSTHVSGGAWSQIYKNGEGNHQVIPIELIRQEG